MRMDAKEDILVGEGEGGNGCSKGRYGGGDKKGKGGKDGNGGKGGGRKRRKYIPGTLSC